MARRGEQDVEMADAGLAEQSDVASDDSLFNSEESDEELEPDLFLVDKILAEKEDPEHGPVFLVKWKNYERKDWSWEPADNFMDKDMINKWRYEKDHTDPSKLFDWKQWDREKALEREQEDLQDDDDEEDEDEDEEGSSESSSEEELQATVKKFINGPVRRPRSVALRREKKNLRKFVVPDDVDDDVSFSETDDSASEDEEPDPAAISTDLGSDNDNDSIPSPISTRVSKATTPRTRRKRSGSLRDKKKAAALEKIRTRSPPSKATRGSSSIDARTKSSRGRLGRPKPAGSTRTDRTKEKEERKKERQKAREEERKKKEQEALKEQQNRPRKKPLKPRNLVEPPAPPARNTLPSAIPIVQQPPRKRNSVTENAGDAAGGSSGQKAPDTRHYSTAQFMHRAAVASRREPPPKVDDLVLFKPGQKPALGPKPAQLSPTERTPSGILKNVTPQQTEMEPPRAPAPPAPPKKKISFQQYQEKHQTDGPVPQRLTLQNLPSMRRKSGNPASNPPTPGERPTPQAPAVHTSSLPTPLEIPQDDTGYLFGEDMMVDSPISAMSSATHTPVTYSSSVPTLSKVHPKGTSVDSMEVRLQAALERGPIEIKLSIGASQEYVGRLRLLDVSPEFRKFWSRLGVDNLTATSSISKAHLPYFVRDFGGPEEYFDIELGAINDNMVRLTQILEIYDAFVFRTEFWQMIVFPSDYMPFNNFFSLPPTAAGSAKLRGAFFYVGRQKPEYSVPANQPTEADLPGQKFEHDSSYLMRCYADVDVSLIIHRLDDPARKSAVVFLAPHPQLCAPSLREMRDAFSCFDCEEVSVEALESYRMQKMNYNTSYTVMVHWTMAHQIYKLEELQILRRSYDAKFYFWGSRPRVISGEDLGVDIWTEKVLPFWGDGIVFYVSWCVITKVPEVVVMIQDYMRKKKNVKLMVCSDFPRIIESELLKRKDDDDRSFTGTMLAMIYSDSPWNRSENNVPYHDPRYFRIQHLRSPSSPNSISEKEQEELQVASFAREVGSSKIYPHFNRFIFLGIAAHGKRTRDKYPQLELHTPDTLSSITGMMVENRKTLKERGEREAEVEMREDEWRTKREERGGRYYDEREEEEIRREAWELAEEKMQESFGADPEMDYYLDAFSGLRQGVS